jgi:hypothetical protein
VQGNLSLDGGAGSGIGVGLAGAAPQGALDIRIHGASPGWDRFLVAASGLWGDPGSAYVTLGTGAAGIMFSNPHVVWKADEGRASVRYGRANGAAGGTFWDAGLRADGSFSFHCWETASNGEALSLGRNGTVTTRSNLVVGGTAELGWAQHVNELSSERRCGFYQTYKPTDSFPDTGHDWVHMLAVRHGNAGNHHQLQIASSYAENDRLFFRKIARNTGEAGRAPWTEVATVTNATLKIGAWTIEARGAHLFFKHGASTVARFANDWDRFQVYRNVNGSAPWFYFNQDGGFGHHDP